MRILFANFADVAEFGEAIEALKSEGHTFVVGGAMPGAPATYSLPKEFDHDLIIVRYLNVSTLAGYIAKLREKGRTGPVVYFATSTDWRESRGVISAGAVDYKQTSSQSLLEVVRKLSSKN